MLFFIRYVALICGLGFGSESQDLLSLQMFSDLVTGELGSLQVRFFSILSGIWVNGRWILRNMSRPLLTRQLLFF